MPVSKLLKFHGTNYKMPIVGLGTGKITDPVELKALIDSAIKCNYSSITLIDTAYGYNNEVEIGKAIQSNVERGFVQREELFIISKLPMHGMNEKLVDKFVNLSLQNLQLDYIDLYLIHWPVGLQFISESELMPRNAQGQLLLDMESSIERVWKALEQQVVNGRVRSIGLSNFNEMQIQRILNICEIRPANLQVEIHACFQQKELRKFCMENSITITAYAPLGSPGRSKYIYAHKLKIPKLLDDPVVKKIAAAHEKTPAQILLRFLVQALHVAVIPKTVSSKRLEENFEIFDFDLTEEEVMVLKEMDEGPSGRSCNSFEGANQHPECPF